jgi:hypothetical protein
MAGGSSPIIPWPRATSTPSVPWLQGSLIWGNTLRTPAQQQDWIRRETARFEAQARASLAQQVTGRTGRDATSSTTGSLLTQAMRAMAVGDPVPVVFARRRTGGTGGVMVQPRATEVQVGNSATTLTVRWHCVLGDGPMASVQVRDVRNGTRRQGAFSQNFGQRAGSWAPGNRTRAIPGVELPALPSQTGGGGDYRGVSTIEFSNTYPITSQRWAQSWNVFCRGGLIIERGRLADGVVGPSDNLCDLALLALVTSGRATEEQIHLPTMQATAQFLEANGLCCDAEFADAASLPDWLAGILPAFLLRETTVDGKFALVPLLPTNPDGTIRATALEPALAITEESLAPGAWSEQPAPAADRGPLRVVATYRQQTSDTEPPLECTLAVGAQTDSLPSEEVLPLAGFCTSRLHAATAAGFRHALRTLAGGTATATLRAGTQSGGVLPGQVVRALFRVETEQEQGWISSWWQVARVDLDGDANETLQLSELPVDSEGRSIISLQVLEARARAGDLVFPYPVISGDDEPGRATDTSVPASSTSGRPFSEGGSGVSGSGGGGGAGGDIDLPPPPPPDDPPPPGDDPPGGSGSSVGTGGGRSRPRPDRRDPGRSRTLVWACQDGAQLLYQTVRVLRPVNGVTQVYATFSLIAGDFDMVLEQELPNQNTIFAPTPMTLKIYGIHYRPIILSAGNPDKVGPYGKQATLQVYIGGPTYEDEIWGDLSTDVTVSYCTKGPRAAWV